MLKNFKVEGKGPKESLIANVKMPRSYGRKQFTL